MTITEVTQLRAIARAWHWRWQIESGDAATLSDIAAAEKVTRPFVRRYRRSSVLVHRSMTVAPLQKRLSRDGSADDEWLSHRKPFVNHVRTTFTLKARVKSPQSRRAAEEQCSLCGSTIMSALAR